jgi:glycosyltransferase involved in cell wall biosynthesis
VIERLAFSMIRRRDVTRPRISIDYFADLSFSFHNVQSLHVYEVCRNLEEVGSDLTLFIPKSRSEMKVTFELVEIPVPRILKTVFYQFLVLPKIIRRWHQRRPDAVYVRVGPYLLTPVLISRLYRIPVFCEINGALDSELASSRSVVDRCVSRLRLVNLVERLAYKNSRCVIAVTDDIKNHIVERYKLQPEMVEVVENGVDTERFSPKTPLPKRVNEYTLGYVGSFHEWQGLQYAIRAMATVRQTYPLATFEIYGEGSYRKELVQLIEHLDLGRTVHLNGSVQNADVPDTLTRFDVCIAYYTNDRSGLTSPFKVYEYLASGKPVIVSNIKGVGDKFSDVTKVVEAENSEDLAQAIINLLADKNERCRLGKIGREYVADGHTWRDVSKRILDSIIEHGPSISR